MGSRSWARAVPVTLLLSGGLLQHSLAEAEVGDEAAATDSNADANAHSDQISEVTVSARRREENVQDVPIPIATVDGQSLERAGRFRLEDLNQRLPSTNVQFNNPRQTSIAVRGLGNNPANDALESSVGVYLDNVYLGRASMANLDLIDLDQVALLRGPQGTLFGKNTTAGVLNISTRLPTFETERTIDASYGDYNYYQLRGVWSQPIIDEKLAGRLSFARTSRDGFVTSASTGRELNGSDRIGGRGQLLWKSNDAFSLRVIGDYSEEHSDTGAAILYYPGPNGGAKYYAALAAAGATPVLYDSNFDSTTINSRQHMDVRQGGGSAEANWKLNDYTVTSITAYRSWWFMPYNDGDGTNLDAITLAGQQVDDHQWTQELRLASPADRPVSYVLGLYYFKQAQDNLLFTQYGSDGAAIAALQLGAAAFANSRTQTQQDLATHSRSLFGQATWKPTEDWELALGLRGTRESKTVNLVRTSTGSPIFVNNASFSAYDSGELDRDDTAYSGLISASYRIAPDVLGYASISRGAKSGGINPTAPVPGLSLESLYVDPEVAQDAELGFKSTLLDRRLTLNANLYWTRVKDYQATLLLQPTGLATFQQILSNIGKVRTRGIETDVVAQPTDALTLRFSASYNDAIYLSYANAPCSVEQLAPNLLPGQKVCDLTGQQLVGAPKWIANPGLTYTHATFSDFVGSAQLDYSWRSSFYGSADNSEFARVKAYGLLNARYALQGRRGNLPWTFSVWSNNVLDKRYVLGGLSVAGRLYNYTETPGLPRTFGATLSVDF